MKTYIKTFKTRIIVSVKAIDRFQQKLFKYNSHLIFIKALIINPRSTGAVLPSSKYLAKEMAQHIPLFGDGLVIELGAGTGVVTEAILKRGIHPSRIVAVEHATELAGKLRQLFPEIKVICGNAMYLEQLLVNYKHLKVCSIVSSLPLRSLPSHETKAIIKQTLKLLSPGSAYIQFTYSYFNYKYLQDYRLVYAKRIWRNLPPARVDVFIRKNLLKQNTVQSIL